MSGTECIKPLQSVPGGTHEFPLYRAAAPLRGVACPRTAAEPTPALPATPAPSAEGVSGTYTRSTPTSNRKLRGSSRGF